MKKYEHGGNIWVKKEPKKWLDFSANINPLGPPKKVKDIVKNCITNINKYPEPYADKATNELAKYLEVNKSNILATAGGIRAMELIIRFLNPNHTLIIQPGFVEYERLAKLYSTTFENYNIFSDDIYDIEANDIENKIKKADLMFICNPSNPTGQVISKNNMIMLLKIAKEYNTNVVVDEAFIHYCNQHTLISYIKEFSNLIIVGSLTKIYSIPALRLGYIVASTQLIKKVKEIYLPWSVNIFSQEILKSLNDRCLREFEHESIELNEMARNKLTKDLKNLKLKVYNSDTNFLLVCTKDYNLKAQQLNDLLKPHYIIVRDCSNFKGLGEYYIRIAVKSVQDNKRLVNALREVLNNVVSIEAPTNLTK